MVAAAEGLSDANQCRAADLHGCAENVAKRSPKSGAATIRRSGADQDDEDQREIPEVFGFAGGDAGFGKRDGCGEFGEVGGLPVLAAGLDGEMFQQVAILFGMEIFGNAVHTLKGENVAA